MKTNPERGIIITWPSLGPQHAHEHRHWLHGWWRHRLSATAVIRLLMYEEAGAAVWAIALVVAIMDYASAKVREKVV